MHTENNFFEVKTFPRSRKSRTQTARSGTNTCKYLLHAGIEPATRSNAVDHSATAPPVPSNRTWQTDDPVSDPFRCADSSLRCMWNTRRRRLGLGLDRTESYQQLASPRLRWLEIIAMTPKAVLQEFKQLGNVRKYKLLIQIYRVNFKTPKTS